MRSRALIIATGVSWRRLGAPRLEQTVSTGVSYGAAVSEALGLQGQRVHVVGGGNAVTMATSNTSSSTIS